MRPTMTLREYFAGQALAGACADSSIVDVKRVVDFAVDCADAMLAELNIPSPPPKPIDPKRAAACLAFCHGYDNDILRSGPTLAELIRGWSRGVHTMTSESSRASAAIPTGDTLLAAAAAMIDMADYANSVGRDITPSAPAVVRLRAAVEAEQIRRGTRTSK